MPQMGESIAEGTVSKWLKKVGDPVQRDEPILEISTDKVDAEIPSPSEGTLVEIVVGEGETVEVGTVLAFLDTEAGAGVVAPAAPTDLAPVPEPQTASPPPSESPPPVSSDGGSASDSAEDRLRTRSTPVVRKIAEEHGVDLASVPGSGHAGRVTKQDILGFIDGAAAGVSSEGGSPPIAPSPAPVAPVPDVFGGAEVAGLDWPALETRVSECRLCDLHSSRIVVGLDQASEYCGARDIAALTDIDKICCW